MKTTPKLTKAEVWSLLPQPRGNQPKGKHAPIPGLDNEDSASDPEAANRHRRLHTKIMEAFRETQPRDGEDPETGPRFVLAWRIFPNKSNPVANEPNCGCGCSCGCS
jgi:hypothetical protein